MSDTTPNGGQRVVTLFISASLPPSSLTTLRNIGSEAADYIAAQAKLAGFDITVSCLVGEATPIASSPPPLTGYERRSEK